MTFFETVKQTVSDMPTAVEAMVVKGHIEYIRNRVKTGRKVTKEENEEVLNKARVFHSKCKDKGITQERIIKSAKTIKAAVVVTELTVFASIIWAVVAED